MTFAKGVILILAIIMSLWVIGSMFIYLLMTTGLVNDWISMVVFVSIPVPLVAPLYYTVVKCACDLISGGGEERK